MVIGAGWTMRCWNGLENCMNLEAIHNSEWPSFKIQAGGPLQSLCDS
jgi:hypothetical protein